MMFFIVVHSNSVYAETFTVVSDYWCPYNCEPNAEPEGFGMDILRHVFEEKGIAVKYILKPWDQALALVESNQYHAVMSANKTDSRKLLFPEFHFSRSTTCFYKHPNIKWKFKGKQSLDNVQLGIIKGYSYGTVLDKYLDSDRDNVHWVSGYNPLKNLLQKMKEGEIDVMIEDQHVFQYETSNHVKDLNLKEDYCLPAANIYMAFAPNHPDTKRYMEIYNQSMKVLLIGDRYKMLMKRYK